MSTIYLQSIKSHLGWNVTYIYFELSNRTNLSNTHIYMCISSYIINYGNCIQRTF